MVYPNGADIDVGAIAGRVIRQKRYPMMHLPRYVCGRAIPLVVQIVDETMRPQMRDGQSNGNVVNTADAGHLGPMPVKRCGWRLFAYSGYGGNRSRWLSAYH